MKEKEGEVRVGANVGDFVRSNIAMRADGEDEENGVSTSCEKGNERVSERGRARGHKK